MPEPRGNLPEKWYIWLEGEIADWKKEGIINDSQAGTILQRYEAARREGETERGGRLVTVLAIMGAVLLGVGVILFFAANWQGMSKALKVAVILGSIIIAYGTGYYLAFEKQNYPRVGRTVIFLGTILYGAGIWLIAQVFHINSHYPNGVLIWILGIIPVIYICGSLSVLIEASLLTIMWTFMEQTGFQTSNWLYLPVMAVMLVMAYRMKSGLAAGITLAGASVWAAVASFVSYHGSRGILLTFTLTAMIGLFYYVIGSICKPGGRFKFMKTPSYIAGSVLFFLSVFIISFRDLVRIGSYAGDTRYTTFFLVWFIGMFLCIWAAAVLGIIKGRLGPESRKSALFIMVLSVLLAVLSFTFGLLDETAVILINNILLFISVIAVVIIGYSEREPVLINTGLAFFVLGVIARYFDFFWDMLPKSVFFMAGGLVLLVGGTLLERNRRKIVREMKVNSHAA
ncbi:MAG: hypothetical protein CVU89_14125 [Firmicutes bacterium HGW-Firmicutes-14]|nr:MAG: hypothetical protein CVU89_14125 [Firmicutes bacterium HGW-Firmicutes-14]